MIEEERDIQLISDYLDGSLPEAEKRQVDNRLNEDDAFRELFVEIKRLVTGIKSQGREKQKQVLVELERTLPPINPGNTRQIWPWVAGVAATVIVLILVVWQSSTRTGTNELFEEFYTGYPNVVTPITRGEQLDSSVRTKAFVAYEHEDYREAIRSFKQVSDQSDTIRFYLANSFLGDGQIQHSAEIFLTLTHSPTFGDQSQWYLALVYLKLNQVEQCATLLQNLKDHPFYGGNAKELLNKLDR